MQQTISILVKGKVQGVYYRQSAREKAIALQLTGEVKNNEDGSVSILVSGTSEQIDQLITWAKQGPSRAKVTDVKVENLPYQRFDNFKVIR